MSGPAVLAYTPGRDAQCLALEAACVQGRAFRLRFRRAAFHVRSESYASWRIFLVEHEGEVVGSMSMALKDAVVHGEPRRLAFVYDLRVHPDHRGRGVAKLLGARIVEEGEASGADAYYTYTLGDNAAPAGLASIFGGRVAGGYRQVLWPVYREWPSRTRVDATSVEAVHEAYLAAEAPFDVYAGPFGGGSLPGHVGSWRTPGAAASAWSNAGILEEVVERLPWQLRALRAATAAPLVRRRAWPPLPAPGDPIRSWILFDVSARDAGSALALMAHVNNLALRAGIDWCYVLTVPGGPSDGWADALRVTRLFSPVVPFTFIARGLDRERPLRPYVDVRDL